jgi:transcriptional regulator with XRE-family HTH domain
MSKALPISALLDALAESLSVSDIVAATNKAHIASQITKWRIDHHMNQTELAHYFGVKQGTISKWESGNFNFTIDKLAEIASKLDLEFSVSLSPAQSESPIEQFYTAYSSIPARIGHQLSVANDYSKKVVSIANSSSYRWYGDSSTVVCDIYEESKEE